MKTILQLSPTRSSGVPEQGFPDHLLRLVPAAPREDEGVGSKLLCFDKEIVRVKTNVSYHFMIYLLLLVANLSFLSGVIYYSNRIKTFWVVLATIFLTMASLFNIFNYCCGYCVSWWKVSAVFIISFLLDLGGALYNIVSSEKDFNVLNYVYFALALLIVNMVIYCFLLFEIQSQDIYARDTHHLLPWTSENQEMKGIQQVVLSTELDEAI